MNDEMKIIREVSYQAEVCYNDAVKLGEHAVHAIKANHRSQLTNLENIAESTFKTSDVFDYIKRQTARQADWRKPYSEQKDADSNLPFGERLRNYLEQGLKLRLKTIYDHLKIDDVTDADKQERRRIHLLLIRQIIRHMVVNYEYNVSLGNSKRREQ
ncbi:MAG TPA: hypothetical protein VFB12_18520 [Ktedonobacteraceae bacterium]|nr:hypothetical protein [Ktedonobacteraceae bacterium]